MPWGHVRCVCKCERKIYQDTNVGLRLEKGQTNNLLWKGKLPIKRMYMSLKKKIKDSCLGSAHCWLTPFFNHNSSLLLPFTPPTRPSCCCSMRFVDVKCLWPSLKLVQARRVQDMKFVGQKKTRKKKAGSFLLLLRSPSPNGIILSSSPLTFSSSTEISVSGWSEEDDSCWVRDENLFYSTKKNTRTEVGLVDNKETDIRECVDTRGECEDRGEWEEEQEIYNPSTPTRQRRARKSQMVDYSVRLQDEQGDLDGKKGITKKGSSESNSVGESASDDPSMSGRVSSFDGFWSGDELSLNEEERGVEFLLNKYYSAPVQLKSPRKRSNSISRGTWERKCGEDMSEEPFNHDLCNPDGLLVGKTHLEREEKILTSSSVLAKINSSRRGMKNSKDKEKQEEVKENTDRRSSRIDLDILIYPQILPERRNKAKKDRAHIHTSLPTPRKVPPAVEGTKKKGVSFIMKSFKEMKNIFGSSGGAT